MFGVQVSLRVGGRFREGHRVDDVVRITPDVDEERVGPAGCDVIGVPPVLAVFEDDALTIGKIPGFWLSYRVTFPGLHVGKIYIFGNVVY